MNERVNELVTVNVCAQLSWKVIWCKHRCLPFLKLQMILHLPRSTTNRIWNTFPCFI